MMLADHAHAADLKVRAGPDNPTDAAMTVIVMAVDSDPRALAAVRSVVDQSVPAEIVLVNTGAGSLAPMLPAHLSRRITLVETSDRQNPGGTRNLGVAHSTAPIVSFLAADCIAPPDWVRARMHGHESGYDLVSSALLPTADARGRISSISWASYVITHLDRAPRTKREADSLLFGLSYRRTMLQRYGLFNEGLRVSEDDQFNQMLKDAGHAALWDPAIVTLHAYPARLNEAFMDQFWRGRRAALFERNIAHKNLRRCLRSSWRMIRADMAAARIPREDLSFDRPREVLWMLRLLSCAYILGVLSSAVPSRKSRTPN